MRISVAFLLILSSCDVSAITWVQNADALKSGTERNLQEIQESNTTLICQQRILEFALLGSLCECKGDGQGGLELFCVDVCPFCNEDETSCGVSSGFFFYEDENDIAFSSNLQQFEYDGRLGRSETLGISQLDCDEEFNCNACEAFVNGTMCFLCTPCESVDGFLSYRANCDNVAPGASFDDCDGVPASGVWVSIEYEAEDCLETVEPTPDFQTDFPTETLFPSETFFPTGTLAPFEPPANDICEKAELLHPPETVGGTLVGTTFEDTTLPFCSSSNAGVWYKFFGNGRPAIVSTCNEAAVRDEVLLDIFEGLFFSCKGLECVEEVIEDRSCGGFFNGGTSKRFETQLGQVYYAFISGFFFDAGDSFNLSVDFVDDVAEDNSCVSPEQIRIDRESKVSFLEKGRIVGPNSCGFSRATGVWYSFTPFQTGTLRASTCSPLTNGAQTIISVLGGGSCETQECLAVRDSTEFFFGCEFGTQVDFDVKVGETYRILVSGFGGVPLEEPGFDEDGISEVELDNGGSLGVFELTLRTLRPPENDACVDAVAIQSGNITGTIKDSTLSDDELDEECRNFDTRGSGVWYSFEGTGEAFEINVCSDEDIRVSVYSGFCGSLQCVSRFVFRFPDGCSRFNGNTNSFVSELGVTYYILVSGREGREGAFELSISSFNILANGVCEESALVLPDGSITNSTTRGSFPPPLFVEGCTFLGEDDFGAWFVTVGTGFATQVGVNPQEEFDPSLNTQVFRGKCENLLCVGFDSFGGRAGGSLVSFKSELFVNYYIFVSAFGSDVDFDISVNTFEPVENDECPGAIPLDFDDTIEVSLAFATNEDRACESFSSRASPSIWYSFVGDGLPVIVSSCSINEQFFSFADIEILTGPCEDQTCLQLSVVQGPCPINGIAVILDTEAGVTYSVVLLGNENIFDGIFELTLSTFEPAANDECEAAIFIEDASAASVVGSVAGGLPDESVCGPSFGDPAVWYNFIGTGAATLIELCGLDFSANFFLEVNSGSCDELSCVGTSNRREIGCEFGLGAGLVVETVLGEEYSILVQGNSIDPASQFELSLRTVEIPPNDVCEDAIPITVGQLVFGDTILATETATVDCSFSNPSSDLFYEIVGTGEFLQAETCFNSNFDTILSVYEKTEDSCDVQCVNTNDDACGNNQSIVPWFAEAGVTYVIRVFGFGGAAGQFSLSVEPSNGFFNDDFIGDDGFIGEDDFIGDGSMEDDSIFEEIDQPP